MIKDSITQGYGASLRRIVVRSASNRFTAFLSGASVTAALQSSIATILILISFIKSGFITLPLAFAAIIGADVSITLVAQVLSLDLSWLSPSLLAGGIIAFNFYEKRGRERYAARAMIGVGLLLLALSLIRQILEPLKNSHELPLLLQPLNDEPALAILLAAMVTWMLHSSLAAIMVFAAFAGHGLISLNLSLHLVLGANLGGAVIPFFATLREGRKVRRATVGNLFMRGTVALLCLPFLPVIEELLKHFEPGAARQLIDFHTGFNLLLALLFLPLVTVLSRASEWLLPDRKEGQDGTGPQYLDESALKNPVIALACAARETLRMAETVEEMLQQTITVFEKSDERLINSIRGMDNKIDRLNQAIKLYLTRLSQDSFGAGESARYLQILTFSTNLEYCGDVIDKSLLELAEKKMRHHESFSDKGFAEIKDFHAQVVESLRLAQSIFLSENKDLATQLIDKKKIMREAENESSKQHFKRLRERRAESVATSSMHLDMLRDLRRINSYVTSVAYAVIGDRQGGETPPAAA